MEKLPWSVVAVATVVCATVAVLLIAGVEVVEIVAVFGAAGTFISILTYGKLQKVENNTNGTMTSQQQLIKDLVEYAKTTVPIDSVKNGTD